MKAHAGRGSCTLEQGGSRGICSKDPSQKIPLAPFFKAGMKTLIVLALVAGTTAARAENAPPLQEVGIDQRLGERVPSDVTLRDEAWLAGRARQYFRKRPVILTLVYYRCPMLCTLVLNGLVRALNALTFRQATSSRS